MATRAAGTIRSFIISGGVVKTFNKESGEWVDTDLVGPISKEDFISTGITFIEEIPSVKWNEIEDVFEIVSLDEDATGSSRWIEFETSVFSPMGLMNSEDSFELLTWTDDSTETVETRVGHDNGVETEMGSAFMIELGEFDTIRALNIQ